MPLKLRYYEGYLSYKYLGFVLDDLLMCDGNAQTAVKRESFQRYNIHRIKSERSCFCALAERHVQVPHLPAMLHTAAFWPNDDKVLAKLDSFQYRVGVSILGVKNCFPRRFVMHELGWMLLIGLYLEL